MALFRGEEIDQLNEQMTRALVAIDILKSEVQSLKDEARRVDKFLSSVMLDMGDHSGRIANLEAVRKGEFMQAQALKERLDHNEEYGKF